jgi:hypothetical protein
MLLLFNRKDGMNMGEYNYENICNKLYDILWDASEFNLEELNQEVNKAINLLKTVDIGSGIIED